MNGHIQKDISNAFNKLKITRDENAIDQIKQKKKRLDLNTIYE